MPQLIQHLDTLAIQKQRDVLAVHFPELIFEFEPVRDTYSKRNQVIEFLEAEGIGWLPCAEPRSDKGVLLAGYLGMIYVDVPFDTESPQYQIVQRRLEHPDGTLRDPSVRFLCLPLARAIEIQKRLGEHGEEWLDQL